MEGKKERRSRTGPAPLSRSGTGRQMVDV